MINLIISIGVALFMMLLIIPIIVIVADSKIDRLERKEVERLQKQAFDALHQIKVERPKP